MIRSGMSTTFRQRWQKSEEKWCWWCADDGQVKKKEQGWRLERVVQGEMTLLRGRKKCQYVVYSVANIEVCSVQTELCNMRQRGRSSKSSFTHSVKGLWQGYETRELQFSNRWQASTPHYVRTATTARGSMSGWIKSWAGRPGKV